MQNNYNKESYLECITSNACRSRVSFQLLNINYDKALPVADIKANLFNNYSEPTPRKFSIKVQVLIQLLS